MFIRRDVTPSRTFYRYVTSGGVRVGVRVGDSAGQQSGAGRLRLRLRQRCWARWVTDRVEAVRIHLPRTVCSARNQLERKACRSLSIKRRCPAPCSLHVTSTKGLGVGAGRGEEGAKGLLRNALPSSPLHSP